MGISEVRAKARERIHGAFKRPAHYLAPGGSDFVPVEVRVSTEYVEIGGPEAFPGDDRPGFADAEVYIKFWLSSAPQMASRGEIITEDTGEAYRLEAQHHTHGQTVLWGASRLAAKRQGEIAAMLETWKGQA